VVCEGVIHAGKEADIFELRRAVPLELGCMEATHLTSMACKVSATDCPDVDTGKSERLFFCFFEGVTGELSTLGQMMKVPNESGLSPNNGLENAFLSDQSMASNPRKGQAKPFGAKTTSHDGKAGHVMTHVCHRARQEQRQV